MRCDHRNVHVTAAVLCDLRGCTPNRELLNPQQQSVFMRQDNSSPRPALTPALSKCANVSSTARGWEFDAGSGHDTLEMSTPESAGLSATPAIACGHAHAAAEGRGTHQKPRTAHCCGRRGLLLLLSMSYYPPPKRAITLTAPTLHRLVRVGMTVALTARLLLLVVALRPPCKPAARIVAAGTRIN